MNDDEILKSYLEDAPEHAGDINRLISEGSQARDILDTVAGLPGPARPQNPQDTEGYLEAGRKALQYGAAQAAVGLGRTAHRLGEMSDIDLGKSVGDGLTGFGKGIAPENYKPASEDFFDPLAKDKGLGGYGWRFLPRTVLEGIPGLLMDVGAGAATGGAGFLVSNVARTFGPAVDARVEANGGREASGSDYAAAAGSSALQAYLNKVGIRPALTSVAKGAGLAAVAQVPGQVAKAGAMDAANGVAGGVIDQVGTTAGTDRGLTIDAHQAIGSGAASGATGGAVRALRGVGDITNAVRYADADPLAMGRLADRFTKTGIEPSNPERAAKMVELADKHLAIETRGAKNDFVTRFGKEAWRKHEDLIIQAESTLDAGSRVTAERLELLRDALGESSQASRYISAIEERNALNHVKAQGNYKDGFFAGGLSGTDFAENTINPASWGRSKAKSAMGSGMAIAGLSEIAQLQALFHPLALAKALAAQGVAYGALRGIDGVTGSRNPAAQVISRFGDMDRPQPTPTPHGLYGELRPTKAPSGLFDVTGDRPLTRHEEHQALEAVRRGSEEAVQGQWRAEMGNALSAEPKAASESPRGTSEAFDIKAFAADRLAGINARREYAIREDLHSDREPTKSANAPIEDHEFRLVIPVRGYTVERARESVRNPAAYMRKTAQRMDKRADLGDELEAVIGSEHRSEIRTMIDRLNNHAHSFSEAYHLAEAMMNDLPSDKMGAAFDVWLKHEPSIKATYAE